MSAVAFIAMWQAMPFRAFHVHLADGRQVHIERAQQVAAAPDLRQFVVMAAAGPVTFSPEQIASCELIGPPSQREGDGGWAAAAPESPKPTQSPSAASTPADSPDPTNPYALDADALARLRAAGVDPAAIRTYAPDHGGMMLMTCFTHDSIRLTQFAIAARDGRNLLTSMTTRWNLHGVETFENGRTLHLSHADDPTLRQRVIVWPPESGTFETFAEKLSTAALQKELLARDERIQTSPREIVPPASYYDSIKPREAYTPPAQPRYWKGEEEWDDEPKQPPGPPVEDFKAETVPEETAPHRFEDQVRIVPKRGGPPVFDLTDCGWFGEARLDPGVWRLDLRRAAEPDSALSVHVWPGRKQAFVRNGSGVYPIWFVEPLLRNFSLYNDRVALDKALAAGPQSHPSPQVPLALGENYTLELWPGAHDIPTPFLHPRLLDPRGKAILDLRGSAWGAFIQHVPKRPDLLVLRLINKDAPDRGRMEMANVRIHIDLLARRVSSPDIAGSTALAVLQAHAHACRDASMLRERLVESMEQGKALP